MDGQRQLTSEEWTSLVETDDPAEAQKIILYYVSQGILSKEQGESLWAHLGVLANVKAYQRGLQDVKGKAFQRKQYDLLMEATRGPKTPGVQPEMKAWERMPEPEYRTKWAEMGKGMGIPQTERWRSWLESKYGGELQAFTSGLKPMEEKYWREVVSDLYGHGANLEPWEYERQKSEREVEMEIEKSWAKRLEKTQRELYERWYKQTPWERGERPSEYAPRLRTTQW